MLAHKQHFLFLSDRGDVTRLTDGYRVNGIAAIDSAMGVVYVDAAWPTRRDATVLAIPLAGGEPKPLATGHGTHRFSMASSGHDFMRTDSAFGVPPVYSIGNTATADVRPFAQAKSLTDRGFGSTELLSVDSKFGKLDAWMIKPPNFDPKKTYPVIMQVYGGPAAPTTNDSWGGDTYLYHQTLASAVRTLYHALGPASLAGQLEGVNYSKATC